MPILKRVGFTEERIQGAAIERVRGGLKFLVALQFVEIVCITCLTAIVRRDTILYEVHEYFMGGPGTSMHSQARSFNQRGPRWH